MCLYGLRADVIARLIRESTENPPDDTSQPAEHGISHDPVETYSNGVRHVEVLDPDGNSLSLAEA